MHLPRRFWAFAFFEAAFFGAACFASPATAQPTAEKAGPAKPAARLSRPAASPHVLPHTFVSPTAATDTPFFVGTGISGGIGDITEYTASGQEVRSIPFPANTGTYAQNGTEYLRGIAATDAGTIVGFNGTFSPELTTYNPQTNSFSNLTAPGWEISNNVSSGSIGVYQGYSFVVNEGPNLGGGQTAMIRFNPDGTSQQFAVNTSSSNNGYVNLTVGMDGDLYVLYLSFIQGTPPTWSLDVYDPVSLQLLRTVNLQVPSGADLRDLAVNAQGGIYAIDLYNIVYHCDGSGEPASECFHSSRRVHAGH